MRHRIFAILLAAVVFGVGLVPTFAAENKAPSETTVTLKRADNPGSNSPVYSDYCVAEGVDRDELLTLTHDFWDVPLDGDVPLDIIPVAGDPLIVTVAQGYILETYTFYSNGWVRLRHQSEPGLQDVFRSMPGAYAQLEAFILRQPTFEGILAQVDTPYSGTRFYRLLRSAEELQVVQNLLSTTVKAPPKSVNDLSAGMLVVEIVLVQGRTAQTYFYYGDETLAKPGDSQLYAASPTLSGALLDFMNYPRTWAEWEAFSAQ